MILSRNSFIVSGSPMTFFFKMYGTLVEGLLVH